MTTTIRSFTIRPCLYPDDEEGVYRVCLETGADGQDATALYDDPMVLGHRYVGPYMCLEPDFAFVLVDQSGIVGYVLGALDSRRFYRRFWEEWVPRMKMLYPTHPDERADDDSGRARTPAEWSATERVIAELHEPTFFFRAGWEGEYPSHLHIDIVERAQRCGQGRRLIDMLLRTLRRRGSRGVHLEMSAKNDGAYAFYEKMGFVELKRDEECIYMGKTWVKKD